MGQLPTGRGLRQALLLGILAALGAGFVAGGRIEAGGDFEALYAAARGLWSGLSPYDVEGQAALIAAQFDLDAPPGFYPFAYPPWYALLAAPLGLMPPGPAGRLFLLWTCACLAASLVLLTRGRPDAERLIVGLVAALFLPVLGHVAIGQHTMPVLLGAALVPAALRAGSPLGAGVGFWLLTFKPHLGLVIAVPLIVHDPRAAAWGAGLVVASAVVSFAVAPGWLVDWPASVAALAASDVLLDCDTCSGLPRLISDGWLGGRGLAVLTAAMFALVGIAAVAGGLLSSPERAAATGCATAVACLPYVRNYDGVLIVAPLVWALTSSSRWPVRVLAAVVWVLPVIGVSDRRLSGWVIGLAGALSVGLVLAGASAARGIRCDAR